MTATDLVLTVTQTLRRHKVVDKFVEYFGPGVSELALPDRATIANMSPENGATMGFFPVDAETLRYLRLTGRDEAQVALVEAYCKAQGLWRDANTPPPEFTAVIEIDSLPSSRASRAEPAAGSRAAARGAGCFSEARRKARSRKHDQGRRRRHRRHHELHEHFQSRGDDRRRAARAQCGGARLEAAAVGEDFALARLARRGRLSARRAACRRRSTRSGFQPAGYGCMTCMGNSGPLPPEVDAGDQGRTA